MDSKEAAFKEVARALQQYGINSVLFRNAIGRRLGLNITDIGCINYLFIKGQSTPTELARYTGLTTGAVTTMLDRLERKNLVVRKPSPSDRRGVVVEVSQNARETVGAMAAGAQSGQSDIMDGFSREELELIARVLNKFSNAVLDQVDKIG